MGPPPPLTAELWDALSPPTREAIRSLIQHYEERLAEFENRTRTLEQRLGISAVHPQQEAVKAPEEDHSGKHEKEHSHQHRRHRVKMVVDEVKHQRHRRKKLLRLLTKLFLGTLLVVGSLLAVWYVFVRIMGLMTSADGAGD